MLLRPPRSGRIRPAAPSLPLLFKRNEKQPVARSGALPCRHVFRGNAGPVGCRADVSQHEVLVCLVEQQA